MFSWRCFVKVCTHEGACSRSTERLLQHAPGAKLPRVYRPSNWFDMREQAPGQICCTSLFQEQAPWCVLKFACRDMTCLQLANQIG